MKPVTTHFQDVSPMELRLSRRRMAPTARRRAVVAIAGVAAIMAVSPTIAGAADEPFRLEASSHGKSVNASLGTFCDVAPEAGSYCEDAAYPLKTQGRLPVHPRGKIVLRPDSQSRPGVGASKVSFRFFRYQGEDPQYTHGSELVEARPTDSSRRAWVVQLPKHLRGARRLSIHVTYPDDGYAHFEAAFTPHPASADRVSKRCRHVAFTPNSDDMAAGIRVSRRVSCAFARDFIRGFDSAGGERYRDYACTWRSVDDAADGLAHTRLRCIRGTRVIFWKRY